MSTAESEPEPVGRVRVLLWCRYLEEEQRKETEKVFDQIGEALRATPGLVGSELLSSVGRPGRFVVLSEWISLSAFQAWEQGNEHRSQTRGMRRFQDPDRRPVFDVLEVVRASSASGHLSPG